ncbi:PolC-type DNA polymerase III [Clostridium cylindrosporum]|uniref:DNA polymerase III PolC-type n=1 Tax=Clostridium cylindrosporum DSM 605 TaxID=1121307 RepID=A0A0J8DFX7_CLOCY|nr:PolC-type DNA polymerase III [Clostridium cylindrosporum]KMT23073.1 DNA polymerase III PolC-type [Clostridium cylindrosporum DSM 605]
MEKTLNSILNLNNDVVDTSFKEILDKTYLKKVYVSKSNKEWNIVLSTLCDVKEDILEKIKHLIKESLSINGSVQLFIEKNSQDIPKLSDILEDSDKFKNFIFNIFRSSPTILCFLQISKFTLEDNKVIIEVESDFAKKVLKDKSIDKEIRTHINSIYNENLLVEFKTIDKAFNYEEFKAKEDSKIETVSSVEIPKEVKPKTVKITSTNKVSSSDVIYGRVPKEYFKCSISDSLDEEDLVTITGDLFGIDTKELKSGKILLMFNVTDYTSSVNIKVFLKPEIADETISKLKEASRVTVHGRVTFDTFAKETIIMASYVVKEEKKKVKDNSNEKRVELHAHTQMSSMDGVCSASSLIKRAKEYGHSAIAITDHGVVQAFPEAMDAAGETGVKVIYGVEGYLVDDGESIVINSREYNLDNEFVVFDIETTGLNKSSEEITEIGAVKVKDMKIIDTFSALINPLKPIPYEITNLTGITNEMVKDKDTIKEVMPRFLDFIGDCPVVAHNAKFDTGFIKEKCSRESLEFNSTIIDTLTLSRWLVKGIKKYKLNILAQHFNVQLENHHRAVDDAKATAEIFIKLIEILKDKGANTIEDINSLYLNEFDINKAETHHVIILVKNYKGLYNLYKLISDSHLKYFHKRPRLPKSLIEKHREGLIIGSACEAGQIFKGVLNNTSETDIKSLVEFYDYLEIQPIANNEFLLEKGIVKNRSCLKDLNKKIVELGEKYNRPVVATGDVHFLNPHDEYYRRILMAGKGFSDADNQPPLYFKSTDEMLEEFRYLGESKSYDVVIKAPNEIADMVEVIKPIPDGTFPPKIDGADDEIRNMTMSRAYSIYGDPLPEIVQKRLDKELNSIISNGYAVLYLISHKIVKKSLDDGYLVGSRGSVGSSFVATMTEITEVNPLPPHYVCPKCKYSEFFTDGSIGSGADLKDKSCPKCNENLIKDGFDIPFEVFLGFEGDKEPDIDLNFSGEYQPNAHKYTEELFGEGYVFRAGTIGTIAEKTAFGYVKNYLDERNVKSTMAEVERLVKGCTGVKRTSGQHPGGVMVVPRDNDIYQFCPIQRPADDVNSEIITTHFDYHSISGRLLKLDILGHDDPTVIRMLQDLTGLDPTKIPLGDEKVLSLFTSTDILNVNKEYFKCEVGTLGLPEFGTKFVRQMLVDTQPHTFAELVRISGLSHGTDVWLNNAQDLIKDGYATLKEVICTRDDIMNYLILMGVKPKNAFTIMERVRKGKGLRDGDIEEMKENNVPQWYIDSCNTIKYMFPKGHAVAYVMMAIRIAYFKVYYPEAYYATYFSVRGLEDFDASIVSKGQLAVVSSIKEIEAKGNTLTTKEKGFLTVLEVANEMFARGITMLPVDLYESDSIRFKVTDKGILPPFRALQGVGETAAKSIVEARKNGEFISKEDLRLRTKISKTVIEIMSQHGCLNGMPDTSQLTLF